MGYKSLKIARLLKKVGTGRPSIMYIERSYFYAFPVPLRRFYDPFPYV